MKTAIYIEDGITQLVLTPENNWEKSVVNSVTNGEIQANIHKGQFFECRGGWMREGLNADSLIIAMGIKPTPL